MREEYRDFLHLCSRISEEEMKEFRDEIMVLVKDGVDLSFAIMFAASGILDKYGRNNDGEINNIEDELESEAPRTA